jgi:hypothetical protein
LTILWNFVPILARILFQILLNFRFDFFPFWSFDLVYQIKVLILDRIQDARKSLGFFPDSEICCLVLCFLFL